MDAHFPAERWFWFDPPFHPGQSVLLHRQPDNVWRIDFQLGWDADPVAERQPERVIPRVQALLGQDAKFELEWVSVYTFACLRMAAFRDGACCSPATARMASRRSARAAPIPACRTRTTSPGSCGSCWRARRRTGCSTPTAASASSPPTRISANSTRSTDFITPKSAVSRTFRDADAAARAGLPASPAARQQRPALDAGDAVRLAAQHAGRGQFRGQRCARRALRRRAGAARGQAGLAARADWATISPCCISPPGWNGERRRAFRRDIPVRHA